MKLSRAAFLRAFKRAQKIWVKRPRTLRCQRCQTRFSVKSRGREPVYCSRTCRQRAYEARKVADHMPLRLLKDDLVRSEIRDLIKREVRTFLASFLGKFDAERQLREILREKGLDDDSLA